jgi:hypothetical protein
MVGLIVGGTARDCAPFLPRAFAKLDELARGNRVYYVFYESNSADETLHMLRSFVSRREGVVFTETTRGGRTERIARGRNVIVEHVESLIGNGTPGPNGPMGPNGPGPNRGPGPMGPNGPGPMGPVAPAFHFFVNLDLDDRCDMDVASVRACLADSASWDIATANQWEEYYDRWALRTESMGDMYDGFSHCIIGYSDVPAPPGVPCDEHIVPPISKWFPRARLEGYRAFPRDGPPYYEVQSAFGALAIYKTWLLRGARYSGTKRGVPECEHVPFHASIKAMFPSCRIVIAAYVISGR